jgi:CDP-glucose 4,6-dehydratase
VSKACADMLGRSYFKSYGLPVCVTRCGNFFGGGDLNWNRLVPGAIRSLLAGEAPVLRSTGQELRDYFYVRDGAMAYIHLAERMAADDGIHGEAFNFSANFRMNSLEMIRAICKQLGSRIEPRILGTATNEIPSQRVNSTLAREKLGWAPRWTFDEALEETLAWYRAHLAGLENEAVNLDEPAIPAGSRLGRAA